ncbi:MAG: NTP transferase domain-containing protein [Planctomycetes bacterium]|nr:NTP transferase domain-containing protein [Planctomycetota bacterium]
MPDAPVYAVIMAGGSGTRFWPVSRNAFPKQLVRIIGETTMIQATVARLQPLIPAERVLVITTAALAVETRRQLPMLKPDHIIAEPVGRDTAACVALAALVVEHMAPGATMILLPADQTITPLDHFQQALCAGIDVARAGSLVTYGISPRFPATGYGYIKVGSRMSDVDGVVVDRVERFVEKPDEATARAYLDDGSYRWNAGIFTWRSDVVLSELGKHCSWLTNALRPLTAVWGTPGFDRALAEIYQPLKKISIDFALMEHAKDICVVTGRFAWDDVGSWDSLYDHLPGDEKKVIARGDVLAIDCADSLFMSQTKQVIAAIGVERMSVIVTDDAILIVPKGKSQQVKQAVERLKSEGRTDLL